MARKVGTALVYITTGVFFLVAAIAQLQGNSALDAFTKAGVACAVMVCIGKAVVYVVDNATKAPTSPAANGAAAEQDGTQPASTTAPSRMPGAVQQAGNQ